MKKKTKFDKKGRTLDKALPWDKSLHGTCHNPGPVKSLKYEAQSHNIRSDYLSQRFFLTRGL